MKIAVFHNLRMGGAKRCLYELSRHLQLQSTKIDLYCFKESNEFLPINKFFNKIYCFNHKKINNFIEFNLYVYFKLPFIHRKIAQLIDNREYDVVFVNHDYLTKAPYILRYLKTPTVYLCHEPPREFYEKIGLYSPQLRYKIVDILRFFLKKIDYINVCSSSLIIGNSNYSCNVIKKIYKKNVKLLRLGVDTSKFKFSNTPREKFYLMVGALSFFKGIDFILKAIHELPKDLQYPLYVVANGGRDQESIIKLARNLKIKLVVKKNINDKQLMELYNKAILFLFAAIKEPLGLCILEAAACGLPSVAVHSGGVKEVFDSRFSLLTKRNILGYSNAIKKIIKRKMNYRTRKKMSKFINKNWSWNQSANLLINYINQIKLRNK